MELSKVVFEKDGNNSISANLFYGLIGLFVIYGLGGTAWVAHRLSAINYDPGALEIILLGIVIPIAGIVLALKSDNVFLSFVGYNMVLVPLGVILSPLLNQYHPDAIEKAFTITCGATFIMAIASAAFPRFFSSLGSSLFFALIGLLIVRIMQMFVPALNGMTWIDWVAAGIFSLYVGYDLWRARQVPRTVDNSIDIALALYLDIINLFLSVLRAGGKK